eukprot:409160-Pleurochrysis_carterae.AAC.1
MQNCLAPQDRALFPSLCSPTDSSVSLYCTEPPTRSGSVQPRQTGITAVNKLGRMGRLERARAYVEKYSRLELGLRDRIQLRMHRLQRRGVCEKTAARTNPPGGQRWSETAQECCRVGFNAHAPC